MKVKGKSTRAQKVGDFLKTALGCFLFGKSQVELWLVFTVVGCSVVVRNTDIIK